MPHPTPAPALVWFCRDLRLADNPALTAAAGGGRPVLPVYVLDEAAAGRWAPGGAARWWLHHSLAALAGALEARGAPLHLARGRAEVVLPALAQAADAAEVHAGRLYEPWARERDRRMAEALEDCGGADQQLCTVRRRAPRRCRLGPMMRPATSCGELPRRGKGSRPRPAQRRVQAEVAHACSIG
jgi:deoxyribodipyrimidine photo-lyase